MKKFFTIIPLQIGDGLVPYHYECKGNRHLDIEDKISFPILAAVKAYAAKDEAFSVYAVRTADSGTTENYHIFCRQLQQLCDKYGLLQPEIREICVSGDESVSVQLDNFAKLIGYAADNDELYGCITYGTKPLSFMLMTALHYAARIKKNAFISSIVYGKVSRSREVAKEDWPAEICDMTALIRMDELINKLAAAKTKDPENIIRMLLEEK